MAWELLLRDGGRSAKGISMMINLWCNLFAAGFHLKVNIDKSWSSLISWLPV